MSSLRPCADDPKLIVTSEDHSRLRDITDEVCKGRVENDMLVTVSRCAILKILVCILIVFNRFTL